MTIEFDIAHLIPIGEENAVSARLLWKQLGMWSAPSIKAKLNEMAAAGRECASFHRLKVRHAFQMLAQQA